MKRFLAVVMCLVMVFALAGIAQADAKDVKVGIILVGDENEGYTYAHIEGIRTALKNCGIDEATQTIWKYVIPEDATCYDTAVDLAEDGCNIIFSNSYGH